MIRRMQVGRWSATCRGKASQCLTWKGSDRDFSVWGRSLNVVEEVADRYACPRMAELVLLQKLPVDNVS